MRSMSPRSQDLADNCSFHRWTRSKRGRPVVGDSIRRRFEHGPAAQGRPAVHRHGGESCPGGSSVRGGRGDATAGGAVHAIPYGHLFHCGEPFHPECRSGDLRARELLDADGIARHVPQTAARLRAPPGRGAAAVRVHNAEDPAPLYRRLRRDQRVFYDVGGAPTWPG